MSDENSTSPQNTAEAQPQESKPFKYVFGEKDNVVFVVFSGKMVSGDFKVFDQCGIDLASKDHGIVVMCFKDVDNAAIGVFSSFAKLQKGLRDKGKILGICGLSPEMKAQFQASGIVREHELYANVPLAWKALKNKAPQASQANSKKGEAAGNNKETA